MSKKAVLTIEFPDFYNFGFVESLFKQTCDDIQETDQNFKFEWIFHHIIGGRQTRES